MHLKKEIPSYNSAGGNFLNTSFSFLLILLFGGISIHTVGFYFLQTFTFQSQSSEEFINIFEISSI